VRAENVEHDGSGPRACLVGFDAAPGTLEPAGSARDRDRQRNPYTAGGIETLPWDVI